MELANLSWMETHYPWVIMLISLGPVIGAALHGAIKLWFYYKKQQLEYEQEKRDLEQKIERLKKDVDL